VSAMRELGLRANVRSDGDRDALHQRRAGQIVSLRCELSSITCARSTFLILHQIGFYLFSTTHCSLLGLIVRSGLDVPTFATRPLHTSPRESTQRRKVELWAKNVREFCLKFDFHFTFRDLLHAVKLRHGTDGFTSHPKEGVLEIFSP
jgi:hypothetical protein